jgi:hypothetical protein
MLKMYLVAEKWCLGGADKDKDVPRWKMAAGIDEVSRRRER